MKALARLIMLPAVLFVFAGNPGASALPTTLNCSNGQVSLEGSASVVSILKNLADQADIEIYIAEKFTDYSSEVEFIERPLGEVLGKLLKGYNYAVIYSKNSVNPKGVYSYTEPDNFYPVDQAGTGVRYSPEKTGSSVASLISGSGGNENRDRQGADKALSSKVSAGMVVTGEPNQAGGDALETGSGTKESSSSQSSVAYANAESEQSRTFLETDSTETTDSADSVTATESDTDSDPETDQEQEQTSSSQSDLDQDSSYQQIAVLEYQIEQLEEEISSGRADAFYEYWSSKKDPKYVYSHRDDLAGKQEQLAALRGN